MRNTSHADGAGIIITLYFLSCFSRTWIFPIITAMPADHSINYAYTLSPCPWPHVFSIFLTYADISSCYTYKLLSITMVYVYRHNPQR